MHKGEVGLYTVCSSHIPEGSKVGSWCTIGRNTIESDVEIANSVKIKNGNIFKSGCRINGYVKIGYNSKFGIKQTVDNENTNNLLVLNQNVTIENFVELGAGVNVEIGAHISNRTEIKFNSIIGKSVKIGIKVKIGSLVIVQDDAIIEYNAIIDDNSIIRRKSVIAANSILGKMIDIGKNSFINVKYLPDNSIVYDNVELLEFEYTYQKFAYSFIPKPTILEMFQLCGKNDKLM